MLKLKVRGTDFVVLKWGRLAEVHKPSNPGEARLGEKLAQLTQHPNEKWHVVGAACLTEWFASHRAAAMAVARCVVERESLTIEQAHEQALDRNAQRALAEQRHAERESERAREAEAERTRRATLPMLAVRSYNDHLGQLAGGQVYIYGERSGTPTFRVTTYYTGTQAPECVVNWSALGEGSVQRAREYALAILRAADEAEAFNRRAQS